LNFLGELLLKKVLKEAKAVPDGLTATRGQSDCQPLFQGRSDRQLLQWSKFFVNIAVTFVAV
jgi:hypothetical protein